MTDTDTIVASLRKDYDHLTYDEASSYVSVSIYEYERLKALENAATAFKKYDCLYQWIEKKHVEERLNMTIDDEKWSNFVECNQDNFADEVSILFFDALCNREDLEDE
jgi:hypothetical protein